METPLRGRSDFGIRGALVPSALAIAAFVLVSSVLSLEPSTPPASKGNRRNLLLITLDTTRPDRLGCYGNASIATPAIDGLARAGALFERAFAHTPTTLPSHTNIMLGLTPPSHGVHDNSGFVVPPGPTTLAEWLKTRGYSTGAFIGAFPLDSRFGLSRGFDVYDDHYGSQAPGLLEFVERKADAVIERSLAWLNGPAGASLGSSGFTCSIPTGLGSRPNRSERAMPPPPMTARSPIRTTPSRPSSTL